MSLLVVGLSSAAAMGLVEPVTLMQRAGFTLITALALLFHLLVSRIVDEYTREYRDTLVAIAIVLVIAAITMWYVASIS